MPGAGPSECCPLSPDTRVTGLDLEAHIHMTTAHAHQAHTWAAVLMRNHTPICVQSFTSPPHVCRKYSCRGLIAQRDLALRLLIDRRGLASIRERGT